MRLFLAAIALSMALAPALAAMPGLGPVGAPLDDTVFRLAGPQSQPFLAVDPARPQDLVLAAEQDQGQPILLLVSDTGGASWRAIAPRVDADATRRIVPLRDPAVVFDERGAPWVSAVGTGGWAYVLEGNRPDWERLGAFFPPSAGWGTDGLEQPQLGFGLPWPGTWTGHEWVWAYATDEGFGERAIFAAHIGPWGEHGSSELTQHLGWGAEPRLLARAGDVYILWLGDGHVQLSASHDGGRTYTTRAVASVDPPASLTPWQAPTKAASALGPDGTLFVAYTRNHVHTGTDLWLVLSHDGGATWSEPEQLTMALGAEFAPAIAAAPNGDVGVLYAETGRDLPSFDDVTEPVEPYAPVLWMLRIRHGDGTLSLPIALNDKPMPAGDAPLQASLAASSAGFDATWVDARDGERDIAYVRVAVVP